MRTYLLLLFLPALISCNALGGIPPETVSAIANAGGGCVTVKSLIMGEAVMMVGSADRGSLRNGEVTVAGGCGGITIKDAATVRAVPPVPGTITTITTPATTSTTVTPGVIKP